MSRGYVYVLSNPSMPDVYKIGHSIDAFRRAQQIYTTGVPEPFYVEFEILCDDAEALEKEVHESLDHHRVNNSREFFKCSLSGTIAAVLSAYLHSFDRDVCESDEYEALCALDRFACALDVHRIYISSSMKFLELEHVSAALDKFDQFYNMQSRAK